MADPFALYIRPGYPRPASTDSGERTEIQYVGLASEIKATTAAGGTRPVAGEEWGDYSGNVVVSEYEPLPGTLPEFGIATVICELSYGGASETIGTAKETTYEIEWVNISRSLFEHPEFVTGATNALTDADRQDVQSWLDERDTAVRAAFGFYQKDKFGNPTGAVVPLVDGALLFAKYAIRGVEFYDDYAPVARKSTTYVGGPPGTSDAGAKETPIGFPNLPVTWEWLKTADRSLRSGGQTRWIRTEEWTGAKKVLLDKETLYLT